MKKAKVLCPNTKAHSSYEKMLFIVDNEPGKPTNIYLQCRDRKCGKWHRVTFNSRGGITIKTMPENYHFDVEKIATLELCEKGS